jgi:hypothetical protein
MTMTIYRHRYRDGLAQSESEMIRALRLRGYAVVVVKSDAMRRGLIEEAMRKAATQKERAT